MMFFRYSSARDKACIHAGEVDRSCYFELSRGWQKFRDIATLMVRNPMTGICAGRAKYCYIGAKSRIGYSNFLSNLERNLQIF